MTHVTIRVSDDPEICYRLRASVFIDEQGFPEDRDAFDDDAVHLLAEHGDRPVGAARIVFSRDTAKIGRICLIPEARGGGLGAALVRTAMEIARDVPGVTSARLSAQVTAMGFYEKLGFVAEGPQHDDLGVPHQMMVQAL
ncbi:GNAT family N-acetyltransferase [Aestuariivita sp.]|jgi:predicted GNAT family N-acyltransferase|uniref:GNAT family N-acetyltransferase n=1 Tax=Aestuariivita sp. TaxID=1872407 RepID=UPI002173C5F3|nr:GNAT family N-acetyltransferase [Aestuariivita sp.]MCE8009723.1 GNAT family N-acetyltransferase [Aestuariivita sp.]